jgi:hypothetical protein
MISAGHRELMNFELRQLWLSPLPFLPLIVIKMMIDLCDCETIKKASACAWASRMDVVLSFQLAKQDLMVVISRCLFMVFVVFSEPSILLCVIGHECMGSCVHRVSSLAFTLWYCKVKLSGMISKLSRTLQPLIGEGHSYPRACVIFTVQQPQRQWPLT